MASVLGRTLDCPFWKIACEHIRTKFGWGVKADLEGTGWKVSGGRFADQSIGQKGGVSAQAPLQFVATPIFREMASVPDAYF